MDTASAAWGTDEGWSKVAALIELARQPDEPRWDDARRERVYQQVVTRAARERQHRRAARAIAAGASAVLLGGLAFWLSARL